MTPLKLLKEEEEEKKTLLGYFLFTFLSVVTDLLHFVNQVEIKTKVQI